MADNFSDDFLIKNKFSIKKASTEYKGKITKEEGVSNAYSGERKTS